MLALVWGQKSSFGAWACAHTNCITAEKAKQVTKRLMGLLSAIVTFYPNLLILGDVSMLAMFPQMTFLDTIITKR